MMSNTPQPKFKVKLWRDNVPPIPKAPKGPCPGALFTVRQMTVTFGSETGLSNVGGSNGTAQLVQNGSTAVLGALGFQLSDVSQVSTLSSLFDQYKIDKVFVRFMSRNPFGSVFNIASPNSGVPLLYIAQDRDDASAPASLNAVKEYDKVSVSNGYTSVDVLMEPRPTTALYAGGAFSGYSTPDVEPWLDIANTSIPHYGIKFGIDPLTATTTSSWVWDVEAYYYISFRNAR